MVVGNCSVFPLSNNSIDSVESHETFYGNGTEKSGYSLHLKNPLQFLKLDTTYDYIGQVSKHEALKIGAMCFFLANVFLNDNLYIVMFLNNI